MSDNAIHGYTALSYADTANVDVWVTDGQLTDSNGNAIHFGVKPTDSMYGIENEYVDRVTNGEPSGRLHVVDGQPYVDNHGPVTLTNPVRSRTIDRIGNADGESGPVVTDANRRIKFNATEWKNTTDSGDITEVDSNSDGATFSWGATHPKGAKQRDADLKTTWSFTAETDVTYEYDIKIEANWDGDGWTDTTSSTSSFNSSNANADETVTIKSPSISSSSEPESPTSDLVINTVTPEGSYFYNVPDSDITFHTPTYTLDYEYADITKKSITLY